MACRTVLIHEFVTGGGLAGQDLPATLAAEGGAMRRALVAEFAALGREVTVLMTLDERLAPEPGPWETVPIGPGHEIVVLRELADRADDAIIVAPETDDLLTRRLSAITGCRARSLGATPAAVEMTSDKLMLGRHLQRTGIAVPDSEPIFSTSDFPDFLSFPLVVKPLAGAGTLDTFLVSGPDELEARMCPDRPSLIQPFIEGDPMSASFLMDGNGREHLVAVGRQRIEIRDGRFAYLGGSLPVGDPGIAEEARRAVKAVPGLRGWVGVDFVWQYPPGKAVILEINPRATTSLVGVVRHLDPGTLARAWLAAFDRPEDLDSLDLANKIHMCTSLHFSTDAPIQSRSDRA